MYRPRSLIIAGIALACFFCLTLRLEARQTPPDTSAPGTSAEDSLATVETEGKEGEERKNYILVVNEEGDTVRIKGYWSHGVFMRKSPTGAALRSLLVPGWGQAYTGHWIKAVVYFGFDVGMIYGLLVQHSRYKENLELSRHQKTDRMRREYERSADFYRDDRNRLIWWTAGLTLLSTFDAYVEAHLYDFVIDPDLGVTPNGEGPRAGVRIRF